MDAICPTSWISFDNEMTDCPTKPTKLVLIELSSNLTSSFKSQTSSLSMFCVNTVSCSFTVIWLFQFTMHWKRALFTKFSRCTPIIIYQYFSLSQAIFIIIHWPCKQSLDDGLESKYYAQFSAETVSANIQRVDAIRTVHKLPSDFMIISRGSNYHQSVPGNLCFIQTNSPYILAGCITVSTCSA